MARPVKNTVDYFPHSCKHKQTMFIIEKMFGNDGYAFWFKMLEIAGTTPGHYIDCNSLPTWDYLLSYTSVKQELALQILSTLSNLDAIDAELWEHRIIWSQNFVDGIEDVYKRRQIPIPRKPSTNGHQPKELLQQNIYNNYSTNELMSTITNDTDVSVNNNHSTDVVSVNRSTQSKVNKSKVYKQ